MSEPANNKAEVRAWLFELLAELERCEDCEGSRSTTAGNKVTIEIQLKN